MNVAHSKEDTVMKRFQGDATRSKWLHMYGYLYQSQIPGNTLIVSIAMYYSFLFLAPFGIKSKHANVNAPFPHSSHKEEKHCKVYYTARLFHKMYLL